MGKKPLEIDMIAGSQLRDTQGEMLSVEGADITDLQMGKGRFNDNHGKGFFNSIGRITTAKKIFKEEDCEDERQKYFWEKVKAPYIYVRGVLYDDDEHPNAKAAAAILRNIHKADCPLKLKASVEGGVLARGIADPAQLARTKIHSVALTFTPANQATLVEPVSLDKTGHSEEEDNLLIESVKHLAKTNVPSFRYITRRASAERIAQNFGKIQDLTRQMGFDMNLDQYTPDELVQKALQDKITQNVNKISELVKALTAGYGGAGAPTSRSGGSVLQAESLDDGRGFKYLACPQCGHEQVYMKHQVKCRNCNNHFPLSSLYKVMVRSK
jgi:hypothetical protein